MALAPTTFSVGANEELIAVDVYQQNGLTTINGVKDLFGTSSTSAIAGEALNATPITDSAVASMTGNFGLQSVTSAPVTPAALVDSAVSTNPGALSALKSLPQTVQTAITAPIPSLKTSINASVAGLNSTLTKVNFTQAANITKMVDSIVGANAKVSLSDPTSFVNIASNLVKEASRIGLGGVFTAFAQSSAVPKKLLETITSKVAPTLLKYTDNKLLMEFAKAGMGAAIARKYPNFLPKYFKNYTTKYNSLKKQARVDKTSLSKDYSTMTKAFDLLKPDWKQVTRSASTAVKTSGILKANSPAAKALTASARTSTTSMAADVKKWMSGPSTAPINTAGNVPHQAYAMLTMSAKTEDPLTALRAEGVNLA